MPIFNPRDVAPNQPGAFLDVSLRQILFDPNGTKAVADNHVGDYSRGLRVVQVVVGPGVFFRGLAHPVLVRLVLGGSDMLEAGKAWPTF
jgi:hypothetical protein